MSGFFPSARACQRSDGSCRGIVAAQEAIGSFSEDHLKELF
jgi:hypothetical protein